jgi:hypothetical protein
MSDLLGTCQGGSDLFDGLVRIAEKPEGQGEVDAAGDAGKAIDYWRIAAIAASTPI